MPGRRPVLTAAVGIAVVALLRQRREAAAVRDGRLPRLGPAGTTAGEHRGDHDGLHRTIARWRPRRARTPIGRAAAAVWAAPMTAVGLLVLATGGTCPRWDSEHGALVARSVRGPARWFLEAQSASAATLGQVVVAREDAPGRPLLVHESVHARQQERLGIAFAIAYPLGSAVWGYRANPFEVAARAVARTVNEPAGPS